VIETSDYFETPQRSERLQLLMHLISNAADIPYLRAPQGAGKTRFARELAARMGDDHQVLWLVAGSNASLREQLATELGLGGVGDNWMAEVLESSPDRPLVLIVDDAERLQLAEIVDLRGLVRAGARLLLVGTGELAQAQGEWDLHFVDLPPFSEAETRAFLEARGRLEPGEAGTRVAAALHRASDGLPGLLLDALDTLPEELPDVPDASVTDRRFPKGLVVTVVVLAGLFGATFYFQDRINALFEARPTEERAGRSPAASSAGELAVEPPVLGQEVAAPKPVADPGEVGQTEVRQRESGTDSPSVRTGKRDVPVAAAPAKPSPPPSEVADEAPDPVLDAIIEEAIKAAAQPPHEGTTSTSAPAVVPAPKAPVPMESEASAAVAQATAPADTAPVGKGKPAPPVEVAREAVATAPARPVAKVPPAEPGRSQPAAARKVPKAPVKTERRTGGLAWLRAQPEGAYTLQLVGARDRRSIIRFVRRHQIKQPYAVFERELNGRPWYSLVAGSYPSREAAIAARGRLPPAVAKGGVWPRTFASIRQQMKTKN